MAGDGQVCFIIPSIILNSYFALLLQLSEPGECQTILIRLKSNVLDIYFQSRKISNMIDLLKINIVAFFQTRKIPDNIGFRFKSAHMRARWRSLAWPELPLQ